MDISLLRNEIENILISLHRDIITYKIRQNEENISPNRFISIIESALPEVEKRTQTLLAESSDLWDFNGLREYLVGIYLDATDQPPINQELSEELTAFLESIIFQFVKLIKTVKK